MPCWCSFYTTAVLLSCIHQHAHAYLVIHSGILRIQHFNTRLWAMVTVALLPPQPARADPNFRGIGKKRKEKVSERVLTSDVVTRRRFKKCDEHPRHACMHARAHCSFQTSCSRYAKAAIPYIPPSDRAGVLVALAVGISLGVLGLLMLLVAVALLWIHRRKSMRRLRAPKRWVCPSAAQRKRAGFVVPASKIALGRPASPSLHNAAR
jgi:hypothetical protein